MIPAVALRLAVMGVGLVVEAGEAIHRAVERRRERRDEVCPACGDDPADRCDVCGRRQTRVET